MSGSTTKTTAQDSQILTLAALLDVHAETRGDRTAFWYEGESYTFAQMRDRSRQVANGLQAEELAPTSRIGFIGKNDSRFFDLLGGCALTRNVLTPINWRLAPSEIVDLVRDFDIRMIFLADHMAHMAGIIRKECPKVQTIMGIGAEIDSTPCFDSWLALQPTGFIQLPSGPEDILLQIHTSGTTGRPKGAMLTNRNIMSIGAHSLSGDVGHWEPDDISLVPLPLFHSGGTCYAFYSIYFGCGTYIIREPRPDLIFEAFRREKITKAALVPAIMRMLLTHPDFDRELFATLECVYYGGAPITVTLLEQTMTEMGCSFQQVFGMTESSTAGTSLFPQEHDVARPALLRSAGRAQTDTQIRIVDANRQDLPQGETGEIVLKSPCIMAGYYKRPRATAEAIVDGWYYTGDMGYLDADGYLFIRDRLRDMIISGGENIYPAEIEQVIAQHPDVQDATAIGVPSEKWGEEVKACVVVKPGSNLSEADLIAHCRTLLAGFKCPKSVDFYDALPCNANGKVLKRVLRERYWPDGDRQVS